MSAFNTLLDLGRIEDLQNYHNANGTTPLEVLRDNMANGREFMEWLVPARWPGYADVDLSMEYAVKTATGMDTGCATVGDYIAQTKYGCTCGQCLGGWLSPRMIFQLRVQATSSMEFMHRDDESRFKTRQAIDPSDVDSLYDGYFIPPSLYPNLCLSFYRGFIVVFRAAYDILKRASPFTVETLLSRVRDAYSYETMYFFNKGGKCEGQSMIGDREFYEMFADDDEFVALPTCANDNEFDLVRRMVGLDPEKQWAPYRDEDDDDDDMDEDEDDSDE
ncbi:hypothetical protein BDZ89DRAFT_1086865 [Hymenopellis radicata]|nr:hypothetical protein BDZ89DRAFT_1086865 [Hymenopellis radicata]